MISLQNEFPEIRESLGNPRNSNLIPDMQISKNKNLGISGNIWVWVETPMGIFGNSSELQKIPTLKVNCLGICSNIWESQKDISLRIIYGNSWEFIKNSRKHKSIWFNSEFLIFI